MTETSNFESNLMKRNPRNLDAVCYSDLDILGNGDGNCGHGMASVDTLLQNVEGKTNWEQTRINIVVLTHWTLLT